MPRPGEACVLLVASALARRGGEEKRREDRRGEDRRHCWPIGLIGRTCQSGNLARCTNLAMRDGLQFGLSCNLANLAYCSIWPIWRLCQSGNLGSIPIWQQHTPRLKNIRETLQIHIKAQQGARLDSDETKTPDWQPKLANRNGKLNPAIWQSGTNLAGLLSTTQLDAHKKACRLSNN